MFQTDTFIAALVAGVLMRLGTGMVKRLGIPNDKIDNEIIDDIKQRQIDTLQRVSNLAFYYSNFMVWWYGCFLCWYAGIRYRSMVS